HGAYVPKVLSADGPGLSARSTRLEQPGLDDAAGHYDCDGVFPTVASSIEKQPRNQAGTARWILRAAIVQRLRCPLRASGPPRSAARLRGGCGLVEAVEGERLAQDRDPAP